MRTLLLVICCTVSGMFAYGAIRPLELREKTENADLIVVGRVESIVRLSPDEPSSSSYVGPRSIAVISVREAWKIPDSTLFVTFENQIVSMPPRFIYVPCDYYRPEPPTSLTEKRDYVLFLEKLGENFYKPVDLASTHRLTAQLVQDFGMNLESSGTKTELQRFKTNVTQFIVDRRKGEPSDPPKSPVVHESESK